MTPFRGRKVKGQCHQADLSRYRKSAMSSEREGLWSVNFKLLGGCKVITCRGGILWRPHYRPHSLLILTMLSLWCLHFISAPCGWHALCICTHVINAGAVERSMHYKNCECGRNDAFSRGFTVTRHHCCCCCCWWWWWRWWCESFCSLASASSVQQRGPEFINEVSILTLAVIIIIHIVMQLFWLLLAEHRE